MDKGKRKDPIFEEAEKEEGSAPWDMSSPNPALATLRSRRKMRVSNT